MNVSDIFGENNTSPVYIQRYMTTIGILEENSTQKVVDFGCADLSFAQRLRNIPGIRQISAVDVDKQLLTQWHFKVEPLNSDYICRRSELLTVSVYCGNVAEKDDRLINYDAVTCIELIEHLEENVLSQVPSTIFGFIKPKIAIFTTPNSDFNQLFPDFKGFRHPDHKFEWSREEFNKWCDSILKNYPDYQVELIGLGKGPTGSEHLGCCSQMAVFTNPNWNAKSDDDAFIRTNTPYELIMEYEYPVKRKTSIEEDIFNSAIYHIHQLSRAAEEENYEPIYRIPLKKLIEINEIGEICSSQDKLREVLIDRGYTVVDVNGVCVVEYTLDQENISDDYDEDL